MIGNFLDQYLITARLGSGSLGETYLAESVLDRSPVALKLIDPELAAKPGLLNKVAELGKLNSPFVLPFTHEASDGRPYLLMQEYFPDNLQSYLAKLRLRGEEVSAETAVSLILHLISRLRQIDYSQLSVHGGLHPRNILVKFEEGTLPNEKKLPRELILADFMQADIVRQATAADEQPVRGLAPFTPPWLWEDEDAPPEQADSRADLFALGHLLYFLLKKEYVHVAKKRKDNQDIDKNFQKLVNDIKEQEENGKVVELAVYAELAALTAVRLHRHAPKNIAEDIPENDTEGGKKHVTDTDLWQRWHHALLTMRRGKFSLTKIKPPVTEEASKGMPEIDTIWQIADPLEFLSPDAPEAQLALASIESEDVSGRVPLEAERPSADETYIEISQPGATNGNRQAERIYKVRPGQGLITVGSHSDKDICLTQDAHIGPHHLNIRQVGAVWQLFARGSGIALDSTPILPNQPEEWPTGIPLTIGSYRLCLRQPAESSATELIQLELLPVQLALEPGYKGKVGIVIRNNGDERSYFKVDKRDLGPLNQSMTNMRDEPAEEENKEERKIDTWFTLLQDGLALNPGEQQEIPLQVTPPLNQASQTRLYQITVRRLGYPDHKVTIVGRIFLKTTTDFVTDLKAVSSEDDGAFRLIIHNKSNKHQTYQVNSIDSLMALKFAAVDTAVETPQLDTDEPDTTEMVRNNGRSQPNIASSQLVGRAVRQAGGGHILSAVSQARRQQRNIQWALRETGSLMPKTRLKFPEVKRNRLQFNETYLVEETVPPSEQAILFFKVQPRKRPFRYQPHREIPFKLTIIPLLGTEEEAREETAVLHVTSRLSQPVWALLLGLLLLGCLLFTGFAAFQTSGAVNAFQATQETAGFYSGADSEGDSLSSNQEATDYLTDPEEPDTDGDGMSDGLEIFLDDSRICPRKIDCNGNGILDPVEVGFATATPTPPGGLPFVTAEPPPTATRIPTVTPTSLPTAQSQPTQTADIQYTGSDLALSLGDDRDNKQQIITLSFNTANQLPANAIVQEVVFFAVMTNPEQYGRLQQELGNIYLTEGVVPSQEQLGGMAPGSLDEIEDFQQMNLANSAPNILVSALPTISRDTNGMVTIRLFFELGSDLDGQADLLQIWSNHDQQASLEHPPTLHITYSLPGSSP